MKRNSKKTKCEIYCEECNPTKEEVNKALLDLLIVLCDGERECLLSKGNNLSDEDKKVIQEYNKAIEFLTQAKDHYKKFESHNGVKSSRKRKTHSTKGQTRILKIFEI